MKLSELKGKHQMKVIGQLMILADMVHDDPAFKALVDSKTDVKSSVYSLGTLLVRDDVCDAIIGILAMAKDITPEEADGLDIMAEIKEMMEEDLDLPSFLSGQQ